MSITVDKITIKFDDNCGGEGESMIYRVYQHVSDYQRFIDENGDDILINGTDDYVSKLTDALRYIQKDGITIKRGIGYNEIPDKVKNTLNLK